MLRHHHHHLPPPSPSPSPSTSTSTAAPAAGKKRGNYSCGRCGLPKKGHVCNFAPSATPPSPSPSSSNSSAAVALRHSSAHRLRRCALLFDSPDPVVREYEAEAEEEEEEDGVDDDGGVGSSERWLFEVMRRLRPGDLMSTGRVSKGWRDVSRKVWRAAEVLSLRVPKGARIGFIGSVLGKCSGGLVRLTLRMER